MHLNGTRTITGEEELEALLSEPTEAVVDLMRRLDGDILLLGAGGKIGPSLARMARRASDAAGVSRRVIAVSRYTSPQEGEKLNVHGVETIRCDLLDEDAVAQLPDAPNVIYLAGLKFGSSERTAATWAMNTYLPSIVCRKYRASKIVAYSTGAVYGMTAASGNGSSEADSPEPIGEYAMSCLGRERMFEYFSCRWHIPVAMIRLFYACELRYGVLVDLARRIYSDEPINVEMGYFNIIWQGDNNAMTLLAFDHVDTPPRVLNVTGRERLSIRTVASALGRHMGKEPRFVGQERETSCLGDATRAHQLFGSPRIGEERLTEWVADWVQRGNSYLGKPTHFEVRDGKY